MMYAHSLPLSRPEQQSKAVAPSGIAWPEAMHWQVLFSSLAEQQRCPPSIFAPTAEHFEAAQCFPSSVNLPEQQSLASAPAGISSIGSFKQAQELFFSFALPEQQLSKLTASF